ncbi:MAG: hypothetical protein U0573_02900 [Phycisphaerales bacterium]|nr:hypothetical protein [Planctomycetota bacterium]
MSFFVFRFAAALALCATIHASRAGTTFYPSRAAWEAATEFRAVVTTFDEPIWPVNSVLTGDWTVGGVTYRGLAGTPSPNIWVMSAAFSPLTGQSLCANGDENTDMFFSVPRRGLAFDVAVNKFGPVTVTVYDISGELLGQTEIAASSKGVCAVIATSRIGRANFRSVLGALENSYLDDVTLGDSTCAADLNVDGQVDDADFVIFVQAYNLLVCEDPAMPPGCPADLDANNLVDDADFSIFAVAYDALICP